MEAPCGALAYGLKVTELDSLGAFRGHLFQHLHSQDL